MRDVKICFILGSNWEKTKGGSEYQVKLIIDYLKKYKNYDIYYIYTDRKYSVEEKNGVKYYTIPKRSKKIGKPYCLDFFRVNKILNIIRPDIIYQRSGSAFTGIAAYYARKNNIKVIWHIAHQKEIERFKIKWKDLSSPLNCINGKFLEYGIKQADWILGQARYQNELLQKNYGRSCDLVISNFQPVPKCEINKKKPIKVVWVANYKKWKRPEIFLKLAEKFKTQKGVKFIMIGRPKNTAWFDEIQNKSSEFSNFSYLGEKPIDEVNRILCKAHIFVNTSSYEGFPNTFIQAWMRQVPVISLNIDPDDFIKKKRIGYFSRTFPQMVKDLQLLLDNPEIREEMGIQAQEFAFKTFSLNNIGEIVSIFEKIRGEK